MVAFRFEAATWEISSTDDAEISRVVSLPPTLSEPGAELTRNCIVYGLAWGNADGFAMQFVPAWRTDQLAWMAEARSGDLFPSQSTLAGQTEQFSWFGPGYNAVRMSLNKIADNPHRAAVRHAEEYWRFAVDPEDAFRSFAVGNMTAAIDKCETTTTDSEKVVELSHRFAHKDAATSLRVTFGSNDLPVEWSLVTKLFDEKRTIVRGARVTRHPADERQLPRSIDGIRSAYDGVRDIDSIPFIEQAAEEPIMQIGARSADTPIARQLVTVLCAGLGILLMLRRVTCSSTLLAHQKELVMIRRFCGPSQIVGAILLLASLMLYPEVGAGTCYRLNPTGDDCGDDAVSTYSLQCSGCSVPPCTSCQGPDWIITAAPIYSCGEYGTGYWDCDNLARTVFAIKSNYQCNPTTHCYEFVNGEPVGTGCASADVDGEGCH